VRARYESVPLATAALLFVVLAVVRIPAAYVTVLLPLSLVLTPLVVIAAPRRLRSEIGLAPVRSGRALAEGVGVVVLSYAVAVGACVGTLGTGRDNWASGLLAVFDGWVAATGSGHTVALIALAVLCLGVLVPVAEEVCYRGLLLHALMTRWGPVTGAVVTSAAWAVVHLGDYGLHPLNLAVVAGMVPSVFLMGLALTSCRLRTGSVFASAAAQGIANLLLALWVARW
jgi:hypothetical protein